MTNSQQNSELSSKEKPWPKNGEHPLTDFVKKTKLTELEKITDVSSLATKTPLTLLYFTGRFLSVFHSWWVGVHSVVSQV